MATITFDTLNYVKRLREVGVPEQQAEMQAVLQSEAMQAAFDLKEVASKRDLLEVKLELAVKIAETKAELVRWIVGAGFLQTVLIAALLLKLIK